MPTTAGLREEDFVKASGAGVGVVVGAGDGVVGGGTVGARVVVVVLLVGVVVVAGGVVVVLSVVLPTVVAADAVVDAVAVVVVATVVAVDVDGGVVVAVVFSSVNVDVSAVVVVTVSFVRLLVPSVVASAVVTLLLVVAIVVLEVSSALAKTRPPLMCIPRGASSTSAPKRRAAGHDIGARKELNGHSGNDVKRHVVAQRTATEDSSSPRLRAAAASTCDAEPRRDRSAAPIRLHTNDDVTCILFACRTSSEYELVFTIDIASAKRSDCEG